MKKDKVESGEQLELIDVAPETAGPILDAARIYKKFQGKRLDFLAKEKAQKIIVLDMVRSAGLTPLKDGVIKFTYQGAEISVTPRDELLKVKEQE